MKIRIVSFQGHDELTDFELFCGTIFPLTKLQIKSVGFLILVPEIPCGGGHGITTPFASRMKLSTYRIAHGMLFIENDSDRLPFIRLHTFKIDHEVLLGHGK